MVWKILGVIAGYAAIVAFIFISFSILYFAIGADLAYEQGTYNVSLLWIVASAVLGLIAAVIGGYICKRISGSAGTVKVFAGLVLLVGLTIGLTQAFSSPASQEPRTSEVSIMEATQKSVQPVWVALLNPFLGAIGILAGGSLGPEREE
ncbi:MAG TPA: hypothetical protein VMM38_03005 [Aridibacter sp.]|nr:hypothetical protein [Aridibacter sp.]